MKKTLIVIPARYGSKRFPGKPLVELEGKPILQRVWEIAKFACERIPSCEAIVATETPTPSCPSDKIVNFCKQQGIPIVVTSNSCRSGSDRAWEVASSCSSQPEIVVNLQGDIPTCPPIFIEQLVQALQTCAKADVATIFTKVSWDSLDALREAKKTSPFSGTTVTIDSSNMAMWFSKNIIPAIRDEEKLRSLSEYSPICRHVGLYAYRYDALRFFANSEKSVYEKLEQLEQLRFLEYGRRIVMTEGIYPKGYEKTTSGVDSPEDLERVAKIIRESGELLNFYR